MPYKMKNGKWRAAKMINGERKTKVFPTKNKARKWETTQTEEEWQVSTIPTALSVANEYLDHCKGRFVYDTYLEKKRAFKVLFKAISQDCSIDNIPVKPVQQALNREAVNSGNTANRIRKNLIAWWNWSKRLYDLPENPFSKVIRYKEERQPRYIPPERDFWTAYGHAEPHDQVFLLTALHTAARRGELFRLAWSDVNFEQGTIRLGTMKTKDGSMEYATLPMTGDLAEALKQHKKHNMRSMLVFTQEDGQAFTSRQHYMKRLCKRAKVAPFGFHAIRHLSASILAEAGVPLPTIQAILRHKSATTTAKYLHSLGIVQDVLSEVFGKKKALEDDSRADKKAICT